MICQIPVPWGKHIQYIIDKNDCWNCFSHTILDGYPYITVIQNKVRYSMSIAKFLWIASHGLIEDKICVLHKCDNRLCINPEHLFLGTRGDNAADMVAKGRQAKGERVAASKLTNEAVIFIRDNFKDKGKKLSAIQLAKIFGVNRRTISAVTSGEHWSHIKN